MNLLYVERNNRRQTFDVYFVRKEYSEGRFVSREAARITWEPVPEALEARDVAYPLDYDAAQTLFDQLWDAGLRPAANQPAEYRAQAKHLEDMRALAFGKLGVTKP